MSYKLKLDVFEGPLDLLLYLIKKDDIDICDIPIAQITDQYLEYINMMKMLDLEVVGEFLVMAATLIQIKSRMLLPPDPTLEEDQEEDPRDDLMKRLQEYKLFKEIAEQLKEKEIERQKLYARHLDAEDQQEIVDDAKEVYFEANLFDLINAFSKALEKFKDQRVYEVEQEEFTVEDRIHFILHSLLQKAKVQLADFFAAARDKMEVIVTFMAVLELIRLKEIKVVQKRMFADIEVVRNTENILSVTDAPEPSAEAGNGTNPSEEVSPTDGTDQGSAPDAPSESL